MGKIGIITVYNSLNCGSFYQAYALQTAINKKFGEAFIVNANTRNPVKTTIGKFCRALLNRKFRDARMALSEYFSYKRVWRKLNIISLKKAKKECELFILGSDEIWNVKREKMRERPIFWGCGLCTNKIVAYAPSGNISTAADFCKTEEFVQNLNEFVAVCVRDNFTFTELKQILIRKIAVCCDPTVLLRIENYNVFEKNWDYKNYIFIYGYGHYLAEDIAKIIDVARKTSRSIIIMGNESWADICIPKDPQFFIPAIKNADYVITETFHGTMFSIMFQKQFVSIVHENQKVSELLEEYGLKDRMYSEHSAKSMIEIMQDIYDHQAVQTLLSQKREAGLEYLRASIAKAMCVEL